MIGWFMVLSFVLGVGLMWLATVRSVTRTIDPVDARRRGEEAGARPLVRQRRVSGAHGTNDLDEVVVVEREDDGVEVDERDRAGVRDSSVAPRKRSTVVPQVVEFEEDTEEFYER